MVSVNFLTETKANSDIDRFEPRILDGDADLVFCTFDSPEVDFVVREDRTSAGTRPTRSATGDRQDTGNAANDKGEFALDRYLRLNNPGVDVEVVHHDQHARNEVFSV